MYNIAVSVSCYGLKSSSVLIVIRIRRTRSMIVMSRICMISIYTMIGNATEGLCSRTMMEGWMIIRHCYMLRFGMYM